MQTPPAKSLTTFLWEGTNPQHEKIKGESMAASVRLAQLDLQRKGILVHKIHVKSKPLFAPAKKKIVTLDILLFTRQLATMLSAGLPMIKAFEIIGVGHENPSMETLLLSIKTLISSGHSLAESLAKYPQYFDNLFCSLISAGERSGTLDTMLGRVATYLEKSQTLKKKIKKAATYPIIVFTAAMGASCVLLLFVVPRFQELFKSFGADLPAFTQMIVNLSNFLQDHGLMIFVLAVLVILGFKRLKKRSPRFVYRLDQLTLKAPVVGLITKKVIIARMTRTLSTTLASGMSIIDAFDCVINVIDNSIYKAALQKVKEEVSSGQQISSALEASHLFPHLVIKMIAVGEESGSLENMLNKVATYYEEDVDSLVDNLSALMEPLIMVVLGVIIGSFVIAMYLPIFKLGSVV